MICVSLAIFINEINRILRRRWLSINLLKKFSHTRNSADVHKMLDYLTTRDCYSPQQSWGKVIFSQASVILLTGGGSAPGGVLPPGGCVCSGECLLPRGVSAPGGWAGGDPPGADTPHGRKQPPQDGYCCGRYASYWNTFLVSFVSGQHQNTGKANKFWRSYCFNLKKLLLTNVTTTGLPSQKMEVGNGRSNRYLPSIK